jgi:NAD(P)-dependent dehydrogenase (short-subunit alcohol dehydrogenase family)
MSGRLAGKVVVVTGSETGIGRAMAVRCAGDGAAVVVVGVNQDQADDTLRLIQDAGGRGLIAGADVREPAQVQQALERATQSFGRIDAVIANAGVSQPSIPFVELTLERWREIIDVNLTGAFITLQAGARRLVAQGHGGCLIATGSSTVFRPHGAHGISYVAAKGGIHTMIRGLAYELAPHRIRVNAIAPGLTDTPMTRGMPGHIEAGLKLVPMNELVQPDELGALAAFVVSDDARHMTGSVLQLDAGRTTD